MPCSINAGKHNVAAQGAYVCPRCKIAFGTSVATIDAHFRLNPKCAARARLALAQARHGDLRESSS